MSFWYFAHVFSDATLSASCHKYSDNVVGSDMSDDVTECWPHRNQLLLVMQLSGWLFSRRSDVCVADNNLALLWKLLEQNLLQLEHFLLWWFRRSADCDVGHQGVHSDKNIILIQKINKKLEIIKILGWEMKLKLCANWKRIYIYLVGVVLIQIFKNCHSPFCRRLTKAFIEAKKRMV